MGDHWSFIFRPRCRAIATAEQLDKNTMAIKLCDRWRWHRGECR